ncbi:hypothetical protein U9M48_004499 [Paspalum notatum var. saurae]|uniref:Uncharacterized protein n=1 Tax=Paspalum notatum var. saurae TaxID=547442 RepID=A0AAQ3SHQ8_PASNO
MLTHDFLDSVDVDGQQPSLVHVQMMQIGRNEEMAWSGAPSPASRLRSVPGESAGRASRVA